MASMTQTELIYFRFADGETLAYKLLSALQSAAPNSKAQQQLSTIYNVAGSEKDMGSLEDQLKIMLNIAADGLKYNNWPWTQIP